MPASRLAALPSPGRVAAAATTAGKHLAQGSHALWTRDSAPFLLLPGSRAYEQCRPDPERGSGDRATAPSTANASRTAALSVPTPSECSSEAGGPAASGQMTGAFIIYKLLKAPLTLRNGRNGVGVRVGGAEGSSKR